MQDELGASLRYRSDQLYASSSGALFFTLLITSHGWIDRREQES